NTGANGKPIDAAKKISLENSMANIRREAMNTLGTALDEIHEYLTGTEGRKNILTMWANLHLPRVMDKAYLEALNKNMDYWQTGKAIILTVLTASYKAEKDARETIIQQSFKDDVQSELITVPDKNPSAKAFL